MILQRLLGKHITLVNMTTWIEMVSINIDGKYIVTTFTPILNTELWGKVKNLINTSVIN